MITKECLQSGNLSASILGAYPDDSSSRVCYPRNLWIVMKINFFLESV